MPLSERAFKVEDCTGVRQFRIFDGISFNSFDDLKTEPIAGPGTNRILGTSKSSGPSGELELNESYCLVVDNTVSHWSWEAKILR